MAIESKLVQTKNSFKVIGKVTRIDKDNAFKEEISQKGKKMGETYRSLKFGVKTSDTNEITVQMFDYEPEKVFMWNSDKKKKDSNYKGDWIPFGTWEGQTEELREQGFAILSPRVGLTYGEDGKLQSHGLPSYVASKEIYENLTNGDNVVIEGEISYSKYKNREDKEVEQKNYNIKKIFKLKELDFDSEKFEEVTYFEQEMVFVDIDIDKTEGKGYVTGRIINYNKTFHDTQMIVNFKDENGNNIADMVKLTSALKSKVKFGDVIKVFGDTLNRVILKEVEGEQDDEQDLFADFGGKAKPKHAQSYVAREYIQEMSIQGIDGWDSGVYTEEDFVVDNLVEDDLSDFGGKSKKPNPFGDIDENDPFGGDVAGDDLPF